MLPGPEQADLEWHFGPGRTLALRTASRSTFGAQLEHASNRYKTSNGRTLDVSRTREVRVVDEHGIKHTQIESWPYAYVKKEQAVARQDPDLAGGDDDEDERDIDLERIERGGRVQRRLDQLPHEAQAVLEALYGPSGLHWTTRQNGRRWAVLPLTRSGGKRLAESQEANPSRWLLEVARLAPRPPWMQAALDQAEKLQAQAEAAWMQAAPRQTDEEVRS